MNTPYSVIDYGSSHTEMKKVLIKICKKISYHFITSYRKLLLRFIKLWKCFRVEWEVKVVSTCYRLCCWFCLSSKTIFSLLKFQYSYTYFIFSSFNIKAKKAEKLGYVPSHTSTKEITILKIYIAPYNF